MATENHLIKSISR